MIINATEWNEMKWMAQSCLSLEIFFVEIGIFCSFECNLLRSRRQKQKETKRERGRERETEREREKDWERKRDDETELCIGELVDDTRIARKSL